MKKRILDKIERCNIEVYYLPDAETDEDEDCKEQTRLLKASSPFSVAGSNQLIEAKGKNVEATSTGGVSWRWRTQSTTTF